ncbi:MAG: hypothetical protein JW969_09960 [Spirochaetales bacterium]|nr:hypothetical protein [Spirochaetales bacterium]
MRKIRLSIIWVCLIISFQPAYSQLFLEGNLMATPWSFEPSYQIECVELETNWLLGMQMEKFMLGASAFCKYTSYDGQDLSQQLRGASFNVGGFVLAGYTLSDWFLLKAGLGGLWSKSSFDYNGSGWLSLDLPGGSALVDFQFKFPWNWMELALWGRFDMLFQLNSGTFNGFLPQFIGGLRLNFYTGLDWLALSMEADGVLWSYSSAILSDFQSIMFQPKIGAYLTFRPPAEGTEEKQETGLILIDEKITEKDETKSDDESSKIKDTEAVIAKNDTEKTEKEVPENKENEVIAIDENKENKVHETPERERLREELEFFKNAKEGDQILLTSIVFVKGNTTFKKGSTDILDKIAREMLIDNSIVIKIAAYSNFMGNPAVEYSLSSRRVKKIRSYLISKKVKLRRLRIDPIGQLLTKKDLENNIEARVLIKILKKK